MAWVAICKNGTEIIFDFKPYRKDDFFWMVDTGDDVILPKGTIKKLIGRDLHWSDEPVELKEKRIMTQQDKDLLIKDLCARLPYGVKVIEYGEIYPANLHNISSIATTFQVYKSHSDSIKPILFPLSAITQEIEVNGEKVRIYDIINNNFDHKFFIDNCGDISIEEDDVSYIRLQEYRFILDAFNKYHIDYRDLIGKGFAISVFDLPENPYK